MITLNESVLQPGLYKHSKTGNIYEVFGVAYNAENESSDHFKVVYKRQNEQVVWVRSLREFTEFITINGVEQPRFSKIEGESFAS